MLQKIRGEIKISEMKKDSKIMVWEFPRGHYYEKEDVAAAGSNPGEEIAPSRTESHELPEYRENNGFICQNKPVACYDQ